MFSTNVVQTYDPNAGGAQASYGQNSFNVMMGPMQMSPINTTPVTGAPISQVSEASSLEAKLALAERTCEIYRHQIRYMQDQIQNLRIVIQDKENVIDNLILRFDLGDIPAVEQDEQLDPVDIDLEELRKKADALAQRTMLENFELREMLTDLRDDNFQLRHEVFELNDRLNRTKLQYAHVTARLQENGDRNGLDDRTKVGSLPSKSLPPKTKHARDESNPVPDLGFEEDDDLESNEEDPIDDPHAIAKRHERERRESIKQHDLFGPGMTAEAIEKRAQRAEKMHRRESSAKVPSNLLPFDNESDEDDGGTKRRGSVENTDHANTPQAQQKRAERAEKHHNRKSSVPTPNLWKDENDGDDDSSGDDDRPDKRRGSITDPSMTSDAVSKRAERAAKAHRRESSAAIPDLFGSAGDGLIDESYAAARRDSYIDPANTEAAKRIRADRAAKEHHRRESSAATPQLFDDDAMDIINKKAERAESDGVDDPAMTAEAIAIREAKAQKRGEHRRDSSSAVPQIFAPDFEERVEKQHQRAQRGTRDSIATPNIFDEDPSQTAQAIEIREARAQKHHKRVSSIPTPNIFADDAESRLEIQQRRAAKRRESFTTPNLFAEDADDAIAKRAERAERQNRKRDSITMPADFFADDDPRKYTPEAATKRTERERRLNAKRDSLVTPAIFQNDPSMTPEAIRKRLERQARKHHRKLSSQAPPNLFAGVDSDEDEKIAMKHARRQSRDVLMRKAGDQGHFSDPETETAAKKQRVEYDLRRKKRKARKKQREQSRAQALEDSHHRRESTIPIPNLHFDSDSDDEKFRSNEDKMKISALEIELERFVEKANQLQRELDHVRIGGGVVGPATIASGPLGDDYDPNEDLIMGATTTTGGGPDDMMMTELQMQLHNAVESKLTLLDSTSREITRLNHVIGVLVQVFNVKWNTVQNMVDQYEKEGYSTGRR